ncbi:hypothetical protein RclHR1_15230004 [Rhizophagus clarus]|uniref:Cysteine proteinase n=1 Tax=Rhizophagus clarus TaxID=94130 RepID=A0A2Z6QS52_9GLOM|nr:hypothetical protein RclHR1_15230004 [Rhizophagus clarus]GET03205.1 cysteine proteinase [Rhizophagus clarus]
MSTVKNLRMDKAKKHIEDLAAANKTLSFAATANLEVAIKQTKKKVEMIAKECRATNRKFRDREFDLYVDVYDCLYFENAEKFETSGIKRVSQIFEKPQFFIDGSEYNDINQGAIGDCWFVAALAVITNIPSLLETLCVARDEEVGVYGFIFFKDGDWVSTVVDDQLFVNGVDEKKRPKLAFAKCPNENETWVPLIEKAYAKVHRDYEHIVGGFTGQGIEDLTGGVYTLTYTADILDTERFWNEELIHVNKNTLFACYRWDDSTDAKGLIDSHAYSIIRVEECEGIKLLNIRNPWGETEWNGPWSDGSKEWTPERMKFLDHKFGDDGSFWMSYEDFLKQWTIVDKCKLFDASWQVYSTWIHYNVVPKSNGKFILTIPEDSFTIIVLQQPDERFFSSSSKYSYQLSFRIYEQGCETYKFRSRCAVRMAPRSVNLEVKLPAGTYEIVPSIKRKNVEDEKTEGENQEEKEKKRNKEVIESIKKKKERRIKNLSTGIDENDESDIEEEKSDEKKKNEVWELSIGLRIYSQNRNFTLVGEEGEYPKKEEEVKKEEDPEANTEATEEATKKEKEGEGEEKKNEII